MTNNQTNVAGPLLLAPMDCKNRGAGARVLNWEATRVQGSVVHFMKPGLAASVASVETNAIDNLTGGLANVGTPSTSVNTGDDAFLGVVTDRGTVPIGGYASVVVNGDMYARVRFVDDGGGDSEAIAEFAALYMANGKDYLVADATLVDETVGRKCGVILADFPAASMTPGVHLVRVLFKGTPAYI